MSPADRPRTPFPKASTPFPNILLDRVMPRLKDTAWRVLCVVVRATLGWQSGPGGARREVDWLSHRTLKSRTGRSSDAVCRAIDTLVKAGLLEVYSRTGRPLLTARDRQRSADRLYFRLAPHLLERQGGDQEAKRFSLSGKGFPKTGFRKAETTKEKQTKYSRQ